MTASFTVDAFGARVLIDVPEVLEPAQSAVLHAAWTGAIAAADSEADLTVEFGASSDFDRAMERVTVDVTMAALGARRGHALMFHAAGVADEQGHVAAFVGPSGRGKTTLSRALGAHFGYVSDETIAVGSDLAVLPYRKPLSIVRQGQPKRQISPQDAGLRDLPDVNLRLSALVLIERDEALQEPETAVLPLTEALPLLITQMSYLADEEHPLQAVATLSEAIGGIQLLRYPDASTVPPMVPGILNHEPAPSAWEPAKISTESGPFHAEHIMDAILADGTVVVMADDTLQVLDGIAPNVWLAAVAGQDLAQITDTVVAEHGEPPAGDASTLVGAALDELIAAGVLQRR